MEWTLRMEMLSNPRDLCPVSVAFQMAEVAIPRDLFAGILRMIAELRPPSVTSTA